jgi:hypothetical protein
MQMHERLVYCLVLQENLDAADELHPRSLSRVEAEAINGMSGQESEWIEKQAHPMTDHSLSRGMARSGAYRNVRRWFQSEIWKELSSCGFDFT